MKMGRVMVGMVVVLAGLLSGCALPNMSGDLKSRISKDVQFKAVLANPEAFKGRTVLWGGQVLEVTNADEGTYIEILQIPLTWEGVPSYPDQSEGRFIVLFKRYLDPAVYRAWRKVTVAGEITGQTVKPMQDEQAEYKYPLVAGEYIHLWPRPVYYRPYYSSTWDYRWNRYPRRYVDPFYYNGFYDEYDPYGP